MNRENYEEIAEKLETLNQWLQGVGMTKCDRIRIHIRNIRELAQARAQGTLRALADTLSSGRRGDLMWSFVEALELADAIEMLIAQGCPPPIDVLERALNGPENPTSETQKNSLGRNTTFEIVFAGDLAAAGLKPQLGSEPDVKVELSERRLLVACKRCLSAASIAQQIEIAARQLGRNLQTERNPRDCGLIAVSVTRAFTNGHQVLHVSNQGQVSDYLDGELRKIVNKYEKSWESIKSPQISGVILHVSTPGWIEEEDLLITAAQTLIVHIAGKSDITLLEELTDLLKAKVNRRLQRGPM